MAISPGFQRKSQFWRNLFTRNRLRTKQSIHFLPLSPYSYEEPVFWIRIVTICSINLSSERWILVYFIGMFFISSYELHSLHAGALIKYHHALSRLTSTLPVVYDIGANVTGCHVTVIRFRSNVPQYSGSQSVMQCGSVICNDCGIKSIHRQPEQCTQFESSLAPSINCKDFSSSHIRTLLCLCLRSPFAKPFPFDLSWGNMKHISGLSTIEIPPWGTQGSIHPI